MGAKKITIYTSPTCKWCKVAEELFASKGLEFETIDISKNISAAGKIFQKYGKLGPLPVIFIGSQVLFGYSRKRILEALE